MHRPDVVHNDSNSEWGCNPTQCQNGNIQFWVGEAGTTVRTLTVGEAPASSCSSALPLLNSVALGFSFMAGCKARLLPSLPPSQPAYPPKSHTCPSHISPMCLPESPSPTHTHPTMAPPSCWPALAAVREARRRGNRTSAAYSACPVALVLTQGCHWAPPRQRYCRYTAATPLLTF